MAGMKEKAMAMGSAASAVSRWGTDVFGLSSSDVVMEKQKK